MILRGPTCWLEARFMFTRVAVLIFYKVIGYMKCCPSGKQSLIFMCCEQSYDSLVRGMGPFVRNDATWGKMHSNRQESYTTDSLDKYRLQYFFWALIKKYSLYYAKTSNTGLKSIHFISFYLQIEFVLRDIAKNINILYFFLKVFICFYFETYCLDKHKKELGKKLTAS